MAGVVAQVAMGIDPAGSGISIGLCGYLLRFGILQSNANPLERLQLLRFGIV
jgi:hypothetical protein